MTFVSATVKLVGMQYPESKIGYAVLGKNEECSENHCANAEHELGNVER